jgi:Leucine-rich repeat (LRR) protein
MRKYALILCILFLSCCSKQHGADNKNPAENDKTEPLMIGGEQFINYSSDLYPPKGKKAFTLGDNLDDIVSLEFFIDPLDRSRMNSLEGIEQLYNAKNIDRIRINVRNLNAIDLSLLERFDNITELDISINASSRVLPDLTVFKSLSVLSISEIKFERPYTLYAPPGLTNLSIGRNNMHLVDLSVIETLHNLRGLSIRGNITRLPDLSRLENLRSISIMGSQLESLEGIGAPNARGIEIGSEKDIDSLSPLTICFIWKVCE